MKRLIYMLIAVVIISATGAFAGETDMGDHVIYTVEKGDKGVTFIAAAYDVSPDEIYRLNPWLKEKGRSINLVYPGEEIVIVPPHIRERLEKEIEDKYKDEIKSKISQIDQDVDETKVAAKQTKEFTEKIMPLVDRVEELRRLARTKRKEIYNVVLSFTLVIMLFSLFLYRKKYQQKQFEKADKTSSFVINGREYVYIPEFIEGKYRLGYRNAGYPKKSELRRSVKCDLKKNSKLLKQELKAKRLIEIK